MEPNQTIELTSTVFVLTSISDQSNGLNGVFLLEQLQPNRTRVFEFRVLMYSPEEPTNGKTSPGSNLICSGCLNPLSTEVRLQKHLADQPKCCRKEEKRRKREQEREKKEDTSRADVSPAAHANDPENFHLTLHEYRLNCSVLSRIPKPAHSSAAEALREVLQNCITENSWTAWTKLLTFAFAVPRLPERQPSAEKVSLTGLVKKNISDY